jgi:hypothetical protein
MSDRLLVALERRPNLANRALVMLLQDQRNVELVEKWIIRNAENDIRFVSLAEQAGIDIGEIVN